jgi:hypothetical protein
MTRKLALEWIRIHTAKGNHTAARLVYIEHRISLAAFAKAVQEGRNMRDHYARLDAEKPTT